MTRRSKTSLRGSLLRRSAWQSCGACYPIDLDKPPELLVDDSRYWFGLFSHQRETSLWKGMIKVPMQAQADDDSALELLDQFERELEGGQNAQET